MTTVSEQTTVAKKVPSLGTFFREKWFHVDRFFFYTDSCICWTIVPGDLISKHKEEFYITVDMLNRRSTIQITNNVYSDILKIFGHE
jgi:hypothetical protein